MPTRTEIEDALNGDAGCLEKWTFMPKICTGVEEASFYEKLWEKHNIKARDLHSGCAYCALFNAGYDGGSECGECPLKKMGELCFKPDSAFKNWCDNPTRENALAMLDKVKHSLDSYFDEPLIDIEPCICGAMHRGQEGFAGEGSKNLVLLAGSEKIYCDNCKKTGPDGGSKNDFIRAWNTMIHEEREKAREEKVRKNKKGCPADCDVFDSYVKKDHIHYNDSLREWYSGPANQGGGHTINHCPYCGAKL